MMFHRCVIVPWLTTASIYLTNTIVASPVEAMPRIPIVSHLQTVPTNTYDQVVAAEYAVGGLINDGVIGPATIETSREIDATLIRTISDHPLEPDTTNDAEPNGSSGNLDPNILPYSNPFKQIDLGLIASENIYYDTRSSEDTSYELGDSTLLPQSANTKLARTSLGYHNWALVCANSKAHTDYCANGRRGYYCSQNGYVLLQVGGTRYLPCEEQCVCANIGVKPACVYVWSNSKGSVQCPTKDET